MNFPAASKPLIPRRLCHFIKQLLRRRHPANALSAAQSTVDGVAPFTAGSAAQVLRQGGYGGVRLEGRHGAGMASTMAILELVTETLALIDLMDQTHAEWPTMRQSELGVLLLDEIRVDLVELADDLRHYLVTPDVGVADAAVDEALALDTWRKTVYLLDQCEAELADNA